MRILIAEDEKEIAMLQKDYLEMNGLEVNIVSDGAKVVSEVLSSNYDLLILDLMLPNVSGLDICREIRDKIDIPILMVTAKTETIDKIRGLGIGADDYIAKPFDPSELVARVKSHLSRYGRLTNKTSDKSSEGSEEIIAIQDLKIYVNSWKVYKDQELIKLPNREFELLVFLANNPNIVFSKDKLFERIWGYDYIGDSATVTVHINRIREKIETDPSNPTIIETIWGAGYRFNR